MHWLLTTALLGTLVQPPLEQLESGLRNASIEVEGVGTVTFGIWVPRDYDPDEPRPLALALHPGGSTGTGYGAQFLRGIVAPALQDWARLSCPRTRQNGAGTMIWASAPYWRCSRTSEAGPPSTRNGFS